MADLLPYLPAFSAAFFIAALSLPILRKTLAPYLGDKPTALKNHAGIIPAVGGCAVALGFFASLLMVRFTTHFPTGTLNNLRGIFYGGAIIFALGIIDDIRKPAGLNPYIKMAFQALAAVILIHYQIRIQFIPGIGSYILTVLWVVGVTNALNLFDIMDGLAASQGALAALAFLVISLPSEFIYVNFAAAALLGAVLGFWPYNHSKKLKAFLGDSGSYLLGFLLAALALGTNYSAQNPLGVFAPLIILALPLFDTLFVSVVRLSKGISPLKGTPDHFPLRLERFGMKRPAILLMVAAVTLCYIALAYAVTKVGVTASVIIYLIVLADLAAFAVFLKWKTK